MSFELNENHQPIRRYIYENGKDDVQGYVEYAEVDDPQYFSFERKGWYSYIKDQVGTITKVYKHETKQIVDTRTYDVFGNLVNQSGSSNGNLGFQSKYYDQESGLNYFYHRYYSPSIGRFINEDPIGLSGGLNLLSFGNNNSVNFVDQYGLFTEFTLPLEKIKPWWDNTYKNGLGELISPIPWPKGNFEFLWFEDITKWTIKGIFEDISTFSDNWCCFISCFTNDETILTGIVASYSLAYFEATIAYYAPQIFVIYKTIGIAADIWFGKQISDKLNECFDKCK